MLEQGTGLHSRRTGKRVRVGRLLRLHADDPSPIASAHAGEIVGLFGSSLDSGDTLVGLDPDTGRPLDLRVAGFDVPEPVVSRTVRPQRDRDLDSLSKALARFAREDPSLRVGLDPLGGLPLISGTGSLQLELYAERLADERGVLRPTDVAFCFIESVRGGSIPREYIGACERGSKAALDAGPLSKAPVVGVEVELLDGKAHSVDSSDLAFYIAARDAIHEALGRAVPRLLEPVTRLEVDIPRVCLGNVRADLIRRRADIVDADAGELRAKLVARVRLAEMFDYATALGSITGGRGSHAMSPDGYELVPTAIASRLVEARAS